jgi:hypothetical protein
MDDIQFVYTFLILDFLAERLLAALSLSMLLSSENATREAVFITFNSLDINNLILIN